MGLALSYYIPGHGTPTAILLGRNRSPVSTSPLRAVLGIRGEPSTPEDPAQGKVWRSVVELVDRAGSENEFVSVTDIDRETLAQHPWSIGGGGAAELKERLEEEAEKTLSDVAESVGITSFTLEDDVFIRSLDVLQRARIEPNHIRPMIIGERIRDWIEEECDPSFFPYDERLELIDLARTSPAYRMLWPFRTVLGQNKMFGGKTKLECGLRWYEFGRLTAHKLRTALSIAFAFVATHNHFVLDRGGKVFNRTAPVIKLPAGASEDEHLALLGLLNSSTACFWMKQVFHDRGNGGIGGGIANQEWERFFEFTGTGLERFPLPTHRPLDLARRLDTLAQRLADCTPEAVVHDGTPTRERLESARAEYLRTRRAMIFLQEELDWNCYKLYSLTDEDLSASDLPPGEIERGERTFEIILARRVARGESDTAWFERHGSTPRTELPVHWPPEYRALVERRIALIESDRDIALVEAPENKRRWSEVPWDERVAKTLRSWLLDRLETERYWLRSDPALRSTAELGETARADTEFLEVASLYRGREDFDVAALIAELAVAESVPYLPAQRYKPSGLRKREEWEATWDFQRREDAGENVGDIPVPPKYAQADFKKSDYWRLRGKLDVPRERFVLYPGIAQGADPSPVILWAGYDHLERAKALASWYNRRRAEGAAAESLVPALAGVAQLLPWLRQWHNEVAPEFGQRLGDYFATWLEGEARTHGMTVEDLWKWTPPVRKAVRGRKKKLHHEAHEEHEGKTEEEDGRKDGMAGRPR